MARPRWKALLLGTLVLGLGWSAPARAVPQGGYAHPENLIQPEELKSRLDSKESDLRIIDFRHKAKYYLGHLPGAVQVWRPEIESREPPWRRVPASKAQLEKLLGRLGVGPNTTLVIYSDQCDHTHFWWHLASHGFPLDRLKLLDGGFEAWKSRGYPAQLTSPLPKPATFKFPPEDRKFLSASLQEVKSAAPSPQESIILDVRTKEQYLGNLTREGAARRGHIPGAAWVYWQEARVQDGPYKGFLKSAAELRQLYAGQGLTPDRHIFIYGHTDPCATFTLTALYLAGYPLEKLHVYAGSWIEWSKSGEPVEAGGPPQTPRGY